MTNIKVVFLGESDVGKTSLALMQQKVLIIKIKNIPLIYGILQEDKITDL